MDLYQQLSVFAQRILVASINVLDSKDRLTEMKLTQVTQ